MVVKNLPASAGDTGEERSTPQSGRSPVSGATLGITDKMEAQPQPPLLILQARPRDEGVKPCDSDLFFPSWLERMLRCLREA